MVDYAGVCCILLLFVWALIDVLGGQTCLVQCEMPSPSSYNFPILLLAVLFVVPSLPGCNSQTTYQLIPVRPFPDDPVLLNTVQLECRDQDSNNLPVEDAMFWVDNTDRDLRDLLRDKGSDPRSIGASTFQFTITRSLEGRYFCGPDVYQTSPMKRLIGK